MNAAAGQQFSPIPRALFVQPGSPSPPHTPEQRQKEEGHGGGGHGGHDAEEEDDQWWELMDFRAKRKVWLPAEQRWRKELLTQWAPHPITGEHYPDDWRPMRTMWEQVGVILFKETKIFCRMAVQC